MGTGNGQQSLPGGQASLVQPASPTQEEQIWAPGAPNAANSYMDAARSPRCPLLHRESAWIPLHSCSCNWVPLGKCAVLFGGSLPPTAPMHCGLKLALQLWPKPGTWGSAALSPPSRLETPLVGKKAKLLSFATTPKFLQMEPVLQRPSTYPAELAV